MKDDAALKAFTEVQSLYPGDEEGEIAAYYLASIKADQGKLAEAEKALQGSGRQGRMTNMPPWRSSRWRQIYFADGRSDQGEAVLRDLMAQPTSVRFQGAGDHHAGALPRAQEARRGQQTARSAARRPGAVGQAAITAYAELPQQ